MRGEYTKLVRLLMEESRSKNIEEDEALQIFKEKCTQWNSDKIIYRGINVNSNDSKYIFVDPSKHERRSANTDNYYTFFIDHISKRWIAFPKRSKSIICTSHISTARGYGKTFIVVPFDYAKIGVCPKYDMWDSFEKTTKGPSLNDLNEYINVLYKKYTKKIAEDNISLESFKEMLQEIENGVKNERLNTYGHDAWRYFIDDIEEKGIIIAMENILDPLANNFKLRNFKDYRQKDNPLSELWTDSPCLLISENSDFFSKLNI